MSSDPNLVLVVNYQDPGNHNMGVYGTLTTGGSSYGPMWAIDVQIVAQMAKQVVPYFANWARGITVFGPTGTTYYTEL